MKVHNFIRTYWDWVTNFTIQKNKESICIKIHFAQQKKQLDLIIMFVVVVSLIFFSFEIIETIFSWKFVYFLIKYSIFMVLIMSFCYFIFFLQKRISINIYKYTDWTIEFIKQWSFFKKNFLIPNFSSSYIIAQQHKWIGNRYYGYNKNYSALIMIYNDQSWWEIEINSIFDDRNFFFTGWRNNIRWVLREEEIEEIAKTLSLPFYSKKL